MKKRILAMLMCLTMIFSSSNVAFAAENLGTAAAEEQIEAVETVEEAQTTSQATVKIHFRNQNKWSYVNAYLWANTSDKISGYEDYGSWPGKSIQQDLEHPSWHTIELNVTDLSNDVKVIFNGNGGQTNDIVIEKSNFQDGEHELWVYPTSYVTTDISYDYSWTFDSVVVDDGKVTFQYKDDDSATQVRVAGGMYNNWQMVDLIKGNDGVWKYTFDTVKAGVYEYKFIIGENGWTTDPVNGLFTSDNDPNSIAIIPGIVLPDAEEVGRGNSTSLPTSLNYFTVRGEEDTAPVTYAVKGDVEGVTLEGNKLTVAEDYAEDTVQLTVSNEAGYTATLDVAVVTGTVVVSPIVEGNTVTFNYRNTTADEVYVAGTMTDPTWADGKVEMEKDPDTNIWTATIENVKPGQHQYKFVVDGEWITDPKNENVGTEGGQTNSLFVIKGDAEDTNKLTVKIHYTGRDSYENWNIWAWNDTMADQLDFEVVDGVHIATVELEARANQYLKFIPREGEWDSQDGGDHYVDLSDLLAGTVNVYVTAGSMDVTRTLEDDALLGVKIKRADYDRTNNQVIVQTVLPVEGNLEDAFKFACTSITDKTDFTITTVGHKFEDGVNKYTLKLKEDFSSLEDVIKCYTVEFENFQYKVFMPNVYADAEFEALYTYTGDDLGSTWTENSTTFKLWAPTADDVKLNLYTTGSAPLKENEIGDKAEPENITTTPYDIVQMEEGEYGVWTVVVEGDLHGKYYTYSVTIGGETTEACDPYARTTGVNGKRAMVINLDSTDPEGWATDVNPNQGMNQTDAIIYELHVRDLSINENSGITNKGKYLGVTETGTKNPTGQATGLDHIIDLGVTHIHFLPIYDYGSVDEADLDTPQFNWGYDPVNYNVPEGSYSTDPYNGEVRVAELKEMVQTLHENNINVIMDVVYNHVYDAGAFAFNQIVPDYFSRTTEDGNYSSRSGCGNDTASERDMVRKYIVESVLYWAEEYHLDGFRFDLVGLVDVNTINQIVTEVHKINPSIVFYGEGWDMDGTVMNPREPLAKQGNAYLTPGFAYFSDTIRDLLRGNNDSATTLGYVSGLTGKEEAVRDAFMARTWWTTNPTQIINYASCHDNYTVMDKINEGRKDASFTDKVKMNNLSAAIYMLAEGVPLIHAGEEMLRTKVDEQGHIIHNSYKSSDYVNSLKWANLNSADYQDAVDYYAGLVEFRKNHEALRLTTADEVTNNVTYHWVTNEVELFKINGNNVAGEVSDGIIVIFNANNRAVDVNLATYGATGDWKVCIDDENAGIEVLRTVSGSVTVDPISALVLVQGDTVDTDSVYIDNGYVPSVEPETTVEVTSVTLNKTSTTLEVGKTETLTATVLPENATNKAVTWSSNKTSVATVSNKGVVTAVAAGTATITVKTANGKTATCTVTVTAPVVEPDEPSVIDPTSITLNKNSVTLEVGKTETLTATVLPENATNKAVTWTTSNANVATVNNGVVTGVAAGTATITVKTANNKTATCTVTVKENSGSVEPDPQPIEVTSITLDKTSAALKKGATVTLTATVNPSNATNKTVTWSTSNAKVATVDKAGKVTAVANGTATITAKAGTKTATCTVTVTTDVTNVTLNKSKANLGVGKKLTLKATVSPSDASNQKLTWSSSDTKIAKVDENGKVTGVKAGTATITVKTANGKNATCKVTVVKATLNATSIPLQIKKSTTALKVTSTLKGDKVKSWKSSNTKVVTVNKTSGKITAKSKTGTATITVTMKSGATATCKVTVQKGKVTTKKLVIDQKKVTLQKGKKVTLTVTRNPITATEKITWSSSNKKVATVTSKGVVTGKKAGTATITAKTSNGKKITCKVTVKNPTVKLVKTKATIKVGKTTTIKIKSTFPENDKVKSFTSSNKKIATVTSKGVVKGVKAGKATITVKMKSGATAKFVVTVKKK